MFSYYRCTVSKQKRELKGSCREYTSTRKLLFYLRVNIAKKNIYIQENA